MTQAGVVRSTCRQLAENIRVSSAAEFLEGRDATHRDPGRPEEWAHVLVGLTSFSNDKCTCVRAITSTKTE